VGGYKPVTRFAIDTRVFVTDSDAADGLDYSIFAIGDRLAGSLRSWRLVGAAYRPLTTSICWESSPTSSASDGRHKEVVLRENRLVGRFANALHYVADTEPGSSGSPVFNSEWRPIALLTGVDLGCRCSTTPGRLSTWKSTKASGSARS
jgi:endonuclease G